MRAEIVVELDGKTHKLAMPIGALEDVAKVNPYPVEVAISLAAGKYRLDELQAVLRAGCTWGNAETDATRIIEGEGLKTAARIASDLMKAAFKDDGGNFVAAVNETTDTASPAET